MTWVRSQMGKTSYLVPLVVMLVLIGMLALNGSRPMAKIKNDGNLPQAVDLDPHPGIFETALVAMEAQVDLGNGVTATAMTFNGIVPGPEIRLKVGDKVIVHFTNNLPIPSSIHWHGIELTNRSDGTGITQDAVPPGGTFTYDFIVPRAGDLLLSLAHHADEPELQGVLRLDSSSRIPSSRSCSRTRSSRGRRTR